MSSPSVFSAEPLVSDAELVERLDLVAQARRRGSWSGVQVAPPFIVGASMPRETLPPEMVDEAVDRELITRRVVSDRGVHHESFSGRGVLDTGDSFWLVEGTEAHDDRFHDFVPGSVRGVRVDPVGPVQLQRIASDALETGNVMLALSATYFSGQDISRFDEIEAPDALDDLVWKMTTTGWGLLRVDEVVIDSDTNMFCEVRVAANEAATTDWSIPIWVRNNQQWVGRIPRAGMRSLHGFSIELPRH